jgi:ubiquinone biosynthesis protein
VSLFGTTTRIRSLRRFGKISRVLLRHGFGDFRDRLRKGGRDADGPLPPALWSQYLSPVRLRQMLEELGPSFIKLGQLMSTRADVFPLAYIEELKKLQDQVPPVSFEAVKSVLETELGQPLDKLFYTFSVAPLAAASVAQVHRAECYTGEQVAVKILRPDIDATIRDDIRLMYYFARHLEKSFEFGRLIGAVAIVKEFERTIFRELDLLIEAGNMEKFAANFKRSEEIHIPAVFWELTTKKVLVMGFVDGVKMDDLDGIRRMGVDPKAVAMIGLRAFSRQLMEFGLFHADPHPANTIVMGDGRVALVDFGITGYLDDEVMLQIAFLLLGYAEHDYDMILSSLEEAGIVDPAIVDMRRFKADLKDMSEPFYGRSLQTISVKDVSEQIMHLIYKYRIQLPRNLLLLLKTFIQTEALGKILGSDASLLEVTRPYARRLIQKGYDAQRVLHHMGAGARGMFGQLRRLPRDLHQILRRTAEGRHRIQLDHAGFDDMSTKLEKGLNRFIVGLIIAASTIAGSLVLNAPADVFNVQLSFFGNGGVSLTGVLGVTGYTIATVLGVWLIGSIFRSGKL